MSNNDKKIERLDKALAAHAVSSLRDVDSFGLDVCFPMSAGIDIGSRRNYVAVSRRIAHEKGIDVVHDFGTTCLEHERCVDFLTSLGITHVAMESTGHYWQILCAKLTDAGIKVEVVNPRNFRMVPGRKTDVKDCQWLQVLHEHGLLKGSFIPEKPIQQLRSLHRLRTSILEESSKYVNRMQKNLVLMNVMLGNVVSSITSTTGSKIIDAIIDGERDPKKLAAMRDGRCKSTEDEIAEALTGTWRDDLVFGLKIARDSYRASQLRLTEVDKEIVRTLEALPDAPGYAERTPEADVETVRKQKNRSKNALNVETDVTALLERKIGQDLTRLDGFGELTVLGLVCEVGYDMSRFPDESHFSAYLGLVPRNKITGGRVLSSKTDRISHPAGVALKKVVPSLSRSSNALADTYHRIKGRRGTAKAITALARRLAENYYRALVHGVDYVIEGDSRRAEQEVLRRKKKVLKRAFGMGLMSQEEYDMKLDLLQEKHVEENWLPEIEDSPRGASDEDMMMQMGALFDSLNLSGETAADFDDSFAF